MHLSDALSPGFRRLKQLFRWYLILGGTPLELISIMDVRYRLTDRALSKSLLISGLRFMRSFLRPCERPSFHHSIWSILIKYWYNTLFQILARYQDQESSQVSPSVWPISAWHYDCCLASTFSHSPRHQCTWLLFNELSSSILLWYQLFVGPWESPLEHYSDFFCVLMILSCLLPLCSWIHSALLCTQGSAIPTNYICVLRDTDQTMPLQESFSAHCRCWQVLFCALSQVQACQGPLFHSFSSLYLEPGLGYNMPLRHT